MPIRNAKGGITQFALRNWGHIDRSRFVFDWVTLDDMLSFEDELVAQGCKVFHLSCRQEDDEARFREEMEAILARGYDAVHLHTSFWRGFLVEELAVAAGVPRIIVHAHSTGIDVADPARRGELLKRHDEWKARFYTGLATHYAACSREAADFLFGEQIPREQILILKDAFDISQFTYKENTRNKMRHELGINNKSVLLQTGRLEYQKNYAFTIELFKEFLKQNGNAALLVAGDGSLRGELEEAAQDISGSVRFLGYRSDIPDLLQAADVFLQPSLFEGYSIATMEAVASGLACLASDRVPASDLISLGGGNLPLDMGMWLGKLNEAAAHRKRDLAAADRLRILGYDIREQIKVLEKVYAEAAR